MYKPYSLTFVLRCGNKFYLGDDNPLQWGPIEAACLYTEQRASEKSGDLHIKKRKACEVLCIIQDERFNFYDGHNFAYSLGDAKLYTSDQGHRLAKKLHDKARN